MRGISSSFDRIRVSLESTDLIRFFEPYLFSAGEVANGKPAPDLFLHVAAKMCVPPADCIVVEDSAVGVAAGVAAGMTVIGFIGGSHAGNRLPGQLQSGRRARRHLRHARAQEHDHRPARVVISSVSAWPRAVSWRPAFSA